jgi:flagellar biosynthesis protein FlhF
MALLKQMVEKLVVDNRKINCPKVPEELFEHYTQLITNEVAEELAQDIMRTLHRELRPEYLTQEKYVRERLAEHIEKLIPSSGPIIRKSTPGPHVLVLIGPTGVGKTTTLAKLAANLKLKERHRVGLITLDTYRIAAVDQLKRYADIIGSPLKVVGTPDELVDAMASMSAMDFVLIDTAGRSPNDVMKLGELKQTLASIEPDEVHLVLSSTSSPNCIDLAIQRFSDVRVDKIIFTKLDEAAHVGVVLNVIKKVNKSLSYVTTGQQVPMDIEVGHGRMLAKMILGENGPRQ